jgi:hypothetical protein
MGGPEKCDQKKVVLDLTIFPIIIYRELTVRHFNTFEEHGQL